MKNKIFKIQWNEQYVLKEKKLSQVTILVNCNDCSFK